MFVWRGGFLVTLRLVRAKFAIIQSGTSLFLSIAVGWVGRGGGGGGGKNVNVRQINGMGWKGVHLFNADSNDINGVRRVRFSSTQDWRQMSCILPQLITGGRRDCVELDLRLA